MVAENPGSVAESSERRGLVVFRPSAQVAEREGSHGGRAAVVPAHNRLRRLCADQSTDSVATSFELGSREVTSRANVQISVTSPTWVGSPWMSLPLLSCVADT